MPFGYDRRYFDGAWTQKYALCDRRCQTFVPLQYGMWQTCWLPQPFGLQSRHVWPYEPQMPPVSLWKNWKQLFLLYWWRFYRIVCNLAADHSRKSPWNIPEKPAEPRSPFAPEPPLPKPPITLPVAPVATEMPLAATIASASMEPPVCPTLTPMLLIKLSIFWDTLRKATAHRNQINTFPVTSSRLVALTAASTSLSSIAKAGTAKARAKSAASSIAER